jgi:hypothetical protein
MLLTVNDFPVPSWDVTNPTLPGREKLGTGKSLTFFTVYEIYWVSRFFSTILSFACRKKPRTCSFKEFLRVRTQGINKKMRSKTNLIWQYHVNFEDTQRQKSNSVLERLVFPEILFRGFSKLEDFLFISCAEEIGRFPEILFRGFFSLWKVEDFL